MKYNKDKMIELFLEKIEVYVSELQRADKELKRAQRIINLAELNQINRIRNKNNQNNLDFTINYDNRNSKIVINDGNIYYETNERLAFNSNYTISSIYSLFEDGIYVKKILKNIFNEELCYKTFFNNFAIEKVVNKNEGFKLLRNFR